MTYASLAVALSLFLASGASAAEPVVAPEPRSAISQESFFAGLVSEAERLKRETDGFTPALSLLSKHRFKTYAKDIRALSAGDLQGHMTLKARGTDSDLKCILTGVSRDLPIKLSAIEAAKSDADLKTALTNMSELLSDNIDVIVTPATTESGLDCTIEFGPDA
ncbi:MAG: hypothetical protein QM647_14740 [Asticcacaulis sp.]|uniref:hypothetical protein n=1 Tax=Asticcacaulis sp. TaxID=1872648 RepID=UPI0039E3E0DA